MYNMYRYKVNMHNIKQRNYSKNVTIFVIAEMVQLYYLTLQVKKLRNNFMYMYVILLQLMKTANIS